MSLAVVLIAVVWAALSIYAVLGGADFGGGILHWLAGDRSRRAIEKAMGPVWEANHVWLIFALTGLLSAFPTAFATLGTALFVPATLALAGIVVRGAGFALGSQAQGRTAARRRLGRAFAGASVAAPLFLGAAAGAIATGRPGAWARPFPLLVGVFAVCSCAALAAAFMYVEMERAREPELIEAFRRRALAATALTAGLALIAAAVASTSAARLFGGLTGRALPVAALALAALGTALVALAARRPRLARAAVATGTGAFVWAWGIAQYPQLAGTGVTVAGAAATKPELTAVAIALAAGLVLLAPSLWLLYAAFRRPPLEVSR